MTRYRIDLNWEDYPIGTKAHAHSGGYWIKTIGGWKWHSGATFPTPGGDAVAVTLECGECGSDLFKQHSVPFDSGDDIPLCAACLVDRYMKVDICSQNIKELFL